jgi:hypothetical protein
MLTALGFNAALICVDVSETQCSERALALLAELILAKKRPQRTQVCAVKAHAQGM